MYDVYALLAATVGSRRWLAIEIHLPCVVKSYVVVILDFTPKGYYHV
jgi:hypothetical protein